MNARRMLGQGMISCHVDFQTRERRRLRFAVHQAVASRCTPGTRNRGKGGVIFYDLAVYNGLHMVYDLRRNDHAARPFLD